MNSQPSGPGAVAQNGADAAAPTPSETTFPVTAAILARNEADRLPQTLSALSGRVRRVVVLDSDSEDDTVAVAKRLGADVVPHHWTGFVTARQRLLELVETPWCLMIDADEVITEAFWRALQQTGFPDSRADAFAVRRETIYLGRRLRYAWQPDWKTILVRTSTAVIAGGQVHEALTSSGRTVRLPVAIEHYSYRNLNDHVRKMPVYARLAAEQLDHAGRRCHWWDLTLRPTWHVLRHLIVKQAWRDGMPGWIAALSSGVATWMRYAFLYERQLHRPAAGPR